MESPIRRTHRWESEGAVQDGFAPGQCTRVGVGVPRAVGPEWKRRVLEAEVAVHGFHEIQGCRRQRKGARPRWTPG